MSKRLTTAEFIEKAKKVHGDRYDYSKVEYKTAKEKVHLICPDHGDFWQDAFSHTIGIGCPECGRVKTTNAQKFSTEEFIKRAVEIHGDKYDYSEVDYRTARIKVTIICREHGEFEQIPDAHLRGHGCAKCRDSENSDRNSIGAEEFIRRAREIHGDKYGYELVEYKSGDLKVDIRCKIHGTFKQTPEVHLRGSGCPRCIKTLNTEDFVLRAREIHRDKYDYRKAVFISSAHKTEIICREHGIFLQSPNKHLGGRGCPKCADISKADQKRHNLEEVIAKFIRIHGDTYDYSRVNYTRAMDKVEIICKEHGSFWATPNHHISGTGCPECGKMKIGEIHSPLKDKFMEDAKNKFNDKFVYLEYTYRSVKLSMDIICPVHGKISITPNSHLESDSGCLLCDIDSELIVGRRCNKCRKLKPLDEYYKFNKGIHGRYITCKICVKKEMEAKCKWETYGAQLLPCDSPTEINGMLWVKCKRCGKSFQPTVRQTRARMYANSTGRGDSNFYCGDECKGSCAIFGKVKYPTYLMKPEQKRDCHKTIKKALVENQCDENGYQYCERCGDIISTDMHHVIEVAKHGTEKAYEPASMMLLCPNCHQITHNQCK